MSVLSFLGLGKEGLSPKQIDKISKLGANPYAQPDVRREQMEKLIRDGSEAAISGLLLRLTVSSSQAIADEEEKQFVVEELIKLGDKALPSMRAFLRKEPNITLPAQALLEILPREEAIGELLALFDVYPPEDHRSDEQKRQLVLLLAQLLSEGPDQRILPKLAPYLTDHSDDVRHQTLELFFARAKQKDAAAATDQVKGLFAELVRTDEASPRIAKQAAEFVSTLEWILPGEGEQLNPALRDEFFLDKKNYLRRRAKTTRG